MGDKGNRLSLAIQNRTNIIQNTYAFTDESCVTLQDQVQRGEYYTFQVAVKSNEDNIEHVLIDTTHLIAEPYILDKKNIICFNQEKVDYQGNPYSEKINLEVNKLKVLWLGIKIPNHQEVGTYIGKISLRKDEIDLGSVQISLVVQEEIAVNHGLEDLERQSRLFWMNSIKGIDHQVTKGYLPIQIKDNELGILGRTIQLAESGLPEQIISYYNDQVQLVD
ncbi:MAG: glycoside hydrolase domain-containing protein, partial [Cellulosilyticaceae bacterium]